MTESKSVRYVTALATATGDSEAVVRRLDAGLVSGDWAIRANRPINVAGSSATEGTELIAAKDGVVVQLAVFDRIGTRTPPAGARWVQLSLSEPDDALSWTRP